MTYQNSIQATRWRDHTGVERPAITPRSSLPPARMWDDDRLDVFDLLDLLHPEWHKRAACANPYHPEDARHREHAERFHPKRGDRRSTKTLVSQFCDRCPVSGECLSAALDRGESGVWGGTSGRDRRELRHQQRKAGAA